MYMAVMALWPCAGNNGKYNAQCLHDVHTDWFRWRAIRSKLAEACVLGLREDLNSLQFRGCVIISSRNSIAIDAIMDSQMKSSIKTCQDDLILLSPSGEVMHAEESLQNCAKLDKLQGLAVDVNINVVCNVAHRRTKPCKTLLPLEQVTSISLPNLH